MLRSHPSRLLARLPLPGLRPAGPTPRPTRSHRVQAGGGAALATDVHLPGGTGPWPTIIIRTPYGRRGVTGLPMAAQAKAFAARGYAVVLQDVRGRFDSTGSFQPPVNEVADSARTVEWALEQTWCNGALGAFGLSYLGGTAWATAAAAPDAVQALVVGISHSRLGLPDELGMVHLDTSMRWIRSLRAMEDTDRPLPARLAALVRYRLPDAAYTAQLHHLPVVEMDELILGERSDIWRTWAAHPDVADPYWAPADLMSTVATAPPTAHVSGWYDLFIDHQVDDLGRQQRAGARPRVVIGPWGHLAGQVQARAFAEALGHFDHHLLGLDAQPTDAVLWMGGEDRWATFAEGFPQPRTVMELSLGGCLRARGDTTLVFDPARPTPSTGGRTLAVDAGRVDCSAMALRTDVVTYQTPPLQEPLTLVGSPRLTVTVETTHARGDIWARLAEVGPDGRATSITDGYVRFAGDGRRSVDLHPVAHSFRRGQQVQLHLAGGAFPHHDRLLGPGLDGLRSTAMSPNRMAFGEGLLALPLV